MATILHKAFPSLKKVLLNGVDLHLTNDLSIIKLPKYFAAIHQPVVTVSFRGDSWLEFSILQAPPQGC